MPARPSHLAIILKQGGHFRVHNSFCGPFILEIKLMFLSLLDQILFSWLLKFTAILTSGVTRHGG